MASPTQNQAQSPLPNVDLFDAYFRRADVDRDGRISGPEAVSFFQGSGLPKQVLAQIWLIANQSQSGFLSRAEFYNALKLVTVAQSKRDLTPEIVKAALYGPAAAKIPPPQMNFNVMPTPQFNNSAAAPAQSHGSLPQSTPSPGYTRPQGLATTTTTLGGQLPHNVTALQQSQLMSTAQVQSPSSSTSIPLSGVSNQRFGIPSAAGAANSSVGTHQQSQLMKPQVQSPASSFLAPVVSTQGFGALSVARPDWSGNIAAAPAGPVSHVQAGGISPSLTQDGFRPASSGSGSLVPAKLLSPSGLQPPGQVIKDSKTLRTSGNGFSSDLFSGGDVLSATSSLPSKDTFPILSSVQTALPSSESSGPALPSSVAGTALSISASGIQHSPSHGGPDSLQHSFPVQPAGGRHHQASFQSPSIPSPSGPKVGPGSLDTSQSQNPWPKMTQTDIQKYTQVFVEVDRDRDGKITGDQARSLFLSWKLPREVLKHVWDLSDQDNDSMLSLREFCTALYLMERFREGRPLPQALPSSIMFDFSNVSQPMSQNSDASWGPVSGFQLHEQQQRMPVSGARQLNPVVGKPPRPPSIPQSEEEPQINQQKSKVPVLESHLINQLSSDEQDSLNLKFKEAKEADIKVEELEKEILDSKEKIEFYRNKMQELVLYKSRCDNRLNEITERVSSDKHEVESLAKKYEDKYKQTGDVASKLTIEEATFRDIQEKKIELYQAILKMENDGNTDGDAQTRADRIQSDLDEVVKSMNECCKKYGLRAKPTTLLELPFGWQPGIQEGAADWDEHWDKFEDEGFTFVKELTRDVQNVLAAPKQKLALAKNVKAPTSEGAASASPPKAEYESEKPQSMDEQVVENGAMHDKSEDAASKSDPSHSSPFSRDIDANESNKIPDSNLQRVSITDTSPHDKDVESDKEDHGPSFSGEKSFDESKWGNFDTNEDIDSLWGFNFSGNSKDTDHGRNGNDHAFDSCDNPIKTGSPSGSDFFDKRSGSTYDDSVPSTPLSIFSTSDTLKRSKDWSEPAFDSFSRFDSFRTDDSGFFPPLEKLARFDSMRSSQDFDQSHHFDESDPFGSGPFRTSLESQNPRKA